MKKIMLIACLGIVMHSCSPKISSNLANTNYRPIEENSEIYVVEIDGELPENSEFIGDLKIGDTGFSNDCGYEKVMEEAKYTARKSGANLLLLTSIKKPNFGSTCYRIKADMYRNLNHQALANIVENRTLKNKSRLPENTEYSIVHFYRPRNFSGAAIGFKIRHNDKTVIGRVRNGESFEFKTKDFGKHKFWAKTESQDSVVIDIKQGEEYFIRCGIKMGLAVGRPELYIMENHIGIKEMEEMK